MSGLFVLLLAKVDMARLNLNSNSFSIELNVCDGVGYSRLDTTSNL